MDTIEQRNHCWHATDYLRGDGAREQICCNCGVKRFAVPQEKPLLGHGKHFKPRRLEMTYTKPDYGCEAKQEKVWQSEPSGSGM